MGPLSPNQAFKTKSIGRAKPRPRLKRPKTRIKRRKALHRILQRLYKRPLLSTSINRNNSTSNDSIIVETLSFAQDQNDGVINESSGSIKDLSEILQKSFCEDDILSHRHSLLVNKLLDGENKQTEIKTNDIINAALQTQDNWEQT